MNSFWTHRDTLRIIRKYRNHHVTLHTFMQSCYPRIDKDTLWTVANAPCDEASKHLWYPPGHGDLYEVSQSMYIFTFWYSIVY